MKGFLPSTHYENKSKSIMTNTLILKSLPYGKWTTENDEEFLFNRDYEPIMGWNTKTKAPIPVLPTTWINGIIHGKTEMYYKSDSPTKSVVTMRKCWNILAEWHERMNKVKV